MKKIQFSALACLILSAAFVPSAFANHRTGSIIAPELLVAGDFNQDGNIDLAVNCAGFDVVAILIGDGQGGFTLGGHFPVDTLTKGLQAGDLNGDGNLDMVVTSRFEPEETGAVAILLGDGAGAFTISTFSVNDRPASNMIGDLNNDGIPDIVVAGALPGNTTGNFISTYLGNGKGQFTLKQNIALGQGNLKGDIALGDFNEDGNLDVAFPKAGSQIPHDHSTSVLLFFGDGTGNLVTGPVLTVGQEPHTVTAADVNHDGHLDLAVTNRTDGTVTALLGDGNGNFTVSSTTSVLSPIE